MDKKITSIRCCEDRPHGQYNVCGRLLAAIDNGKIYLFCDVCKTFYEVTVKDNDNVEMKPLPKDSRLNMETKLKAIF